MKIREKSSLSILAALIAAAAFATTAYAADYPSDPNYPGITYPPSSSSSSSSSSTSSGTSAAAPSNTTSGGSEESGLTKTEASVNVVSNDKLESTIAKATTSVSANVKNMKNLVLSADVMKAAADKDVKLKFKSANLTLVVSDIKDADKVDLSSKVSASKSKMTVVMNNDGDFGCKVKMTIDKSTIKMSSSKLKKAHIYLDGKDMGKVKLDKKGNVVLSMTTGGTYVIK